jgi:hypothetical protein
MVRQFEDLRSISNPVERKREFLLRVDRNQVARDFATALARVGGPELQAAVVDRDGTIDPVLPAAIAGPFPVVAAPLLVVAYVGLFVVAVTEFAAYQHNALWAAEPLHQGARSETGEIVNWLGLTRTNLKSVADVLAAAMTETARQLKSDGVLGGSADEVQAVLDKLSFRGRL